jgi:protein subunit release factor A
MTYPASRLQGGHPTRVLEIRAGEGGGDARLFVADLATAYLRLADGKA